MVNLKRHLAQLAAATAFIGVVFSSCNNTPDATELSQRTTLAQPVTQPLRFSPAQKMGISALKSFSVHPDVKSFNLDKLPLKRYDTGAFKPVKYQPEIKKFDFKGLPSRPFDIDKLPPAALKFKLYKLQAPKLIKAGARRLINSQAAVFEFGEAQGLKADTISSTYTDRDGFVWIGTNRGLYRYDGENFWLFGGLPQKQAILTIFQDKQGLLWVGTFAGYLEVIDIKNGIVKTVDTKNKTALLTVSGILTDGRQRIWTASWTGGLSVIDPVHQTIRFLGKRDGLSGDHTPSITLDAANNIWMASTTGGLTYIDLKNKTIKYADSLHGLATNEVRMVFVDRNDRLWVGQINGSINIIDFKKSLVQTIREPVGAFREDFNAIFTMVQDAIGRTWVGHMGNGVEVIDLENQTRAYLNNTADLGPQYIINLNCDTRGQIWVAGLAKLNLVETNKFVLQQIGNAPTTSLYEDHNGWIWRAGDFDGVEIIDRKKKTIHRLNATNGLAKDTMEFLREYRGKMLLTDNADLYIIDSARRTITTMGKKQGFFGPFRSWAFDRNGKMWMGGYGSGIEVYNASNNTVKLLGKKEGIRDGDIEDMCTDTAGNIWISTESAGIGIINPKNETIRYVDNADLKSEQQRVLLTDKVGNIWAADPNGLYRLNLASQTVTRFSQQQGLTDKGAIGILAHDNKIYVATLKGLSIITPPPATGKSKNWRVESIGRFFGLGRKNEDEEPDAISRDGVYWEGDMGVTAFDLAARDTTNHAAYITGIKIMDSTSYFTGYMPAKAGGIKWDRAIGLSNMPVNLHLPYDQNFMQFNFAVLNVARHDTVYYKYKLSGVDKAWSETTDETFTRNYINLVPGKYVFEVSSMGYNKAWNKPAVVSFTIDPPWWQTWWAYIAYVILFIGSILGFSHYRSIKLIKDKRVLEHKVHIRTEEVLSQKEEIENQRDNLEKAFGELKAAQNQLIQSEKMASLGELTAGIAHEIQNPLNFVNNFSEVSVELLAELKEEEAKGNKNEVVAIADDLTQNLEKIRHHGKRADAIVKGMLQHSQSGSGAKEMTNINALADEYLRLSYHGLRSKDKNFNTEMVRHFDGKLPQINVIPQDIGRVLLNLFNNAFYAVNKKQKTAGLEYKPEVTLTTSTANGQVVIKVKDNGTGIPDAIKEKIMQPFFTTKPTGEGTGLGLSLTYDMVVKGHGGDIQVNSVEGVGSEFIIQLPLN